MTGAVPGTHSAGGETGNLFKYKNKNKNDELEKGYLKLKRIWQNV